MKRADKPQKINVLPEHVPDELKSVNRWVVWKWEKRGGVWTKPPYQAKDINKNAASTRAGTWADFNTAINTYTNNESVAGIGITMQPEKDNLVGVDLDNAINTETGEIESWAARWVDHFNSYTEISPSGTGLRIFVRGTLTNHPEGRKLGNTEIYDSGRYMTVTGQAIGDNTTIREAQAEIDAFHHEIWPPKPYSPPAPPARPTNATDAEVLERAAANKNGAKFNALWQGDISLHQNDHSRADAALTNMLWFETGDSEQVDRLFRQSGLMREKWDQAHYSDGTTYGQRTLEKYATGNVRSVKSARVSVTVKEPGNNPATGEENETLAPIIKAPGVYIENHSYYIDKSKKEGGETIWIPNQLTNWTFEPTLNVRHPDGSSSERGNLTINGSITHEVDIPAEAWAARKDLLAVISKFNAVCFTTNNTDIAKIRQSIILEYKDLPIANGVKTYGLHYHQDEWVGVYEDQTISSRPTPPLLFSGTPVDPGSPAFARPAPAHDDEILAAKKALTILPSLATREAVLAMMGYAVSSAFSPRITTLLGNVLPFVYIAGEREAGKTSVAQAVLDLATGSNARHHRASGMTNYQYDLAFGNTNNLLGLLDEFKPGEVEDAQFRTHHNLMKKWRGSGVASKDHSWHLNAPMIVLGEGITEDAASLSRGALYFLKKGDRGSLETYSKFQETNLQPYATHLHEAARILSDTVINTTYDHAKTIAKRVKGGLGGPRLEFALTYIAFGLLFLQADTQSPVFSDEQIEACLKTGVDTMLQGGKEGTTNFEKFLEQLGSAAIEHKDPGSLIAPGIEVGTLIIRISPSVNATVKRFGKNAAITNARMVRDLAKGDKSVDDAEIHKAFGGKSVRGLKIFLAKVNEQKIDISGLEYLDARLRA